MSTRSCSSFWPSGISASTLRVSPDTPSDRVDFAEISEALRPNRLSEPGCCALPFTASASGMVIVQLPERMSTPSV